MIMRDAHQLLLATRARTIDLEKSASIASKLLYKAFLSSAGVVPQLRTDSCTRTPWNVSVPSAPLRQACVFRCWSEAPMRLATLLILTMLLKNFAHWQKKQEWIFSEYLIALNVVNQMKVCIDAVRATGKVAVMCVCYTLDIAISEIHCIGYYRKVRIEMCRSWYSHDWHQGHGRSA